jgi:hypothetical protein
MGGEDSTAETLGIVLQGGNLGHFLLTCKGTPASAILACEVGLPRQFCLEGREPVAQGFSVGSGPLICLMFACGSGSDVLPKSLGQMASQH